MTDTKFVCSVCQNVFSEHRAVADPVDPEEDQIRCPRCGSALVEPDHFDPNEPVESLLEEPEQEGYGP
jgi:DNA-directed RNA polymerase subunit RPC12/RpoP